jgi:hypothetical protein
MLYTCYNYHSDHIKNTVIFIKDNNIINVYANVNHDDIKLLFVITEENIKKYRSLYKIYITSLLMTKDPTKLIHDDYGYCISKKTNLNNLHITKYYNCEDTYMYTYPTMSYELSTLGDIARKMYIICYIVSIENELLSELIEDEANKIEKELKICEDNNDEFMMYFLYMKKILPENIPDDLTNIILRNLL